MKQSKSKSKKPENPQKKFAMAFMRIVHESLDKKGDQEKALANPEKFVSKLVREVRNYRTFTAALGPMKPFTLKGTFLFAEPAPLGRKPSTTQLYGK